MADLLTGASGPLRVAVRCGPSASMTSAALPIIQTAFPAKGRPFTPVAEAALLPHLVSCATKLAHGRAAFLIPEFVGPCGVCDLALVLPDVDALAARVQGLLPPLRNQVDAAIVSACTTPRSAAQIARTFRWDVSVVERRVPQLRRSGHLNKTGMTFCADPSLRPVGKVIAIEAKVNDWRRGIEQAARYAIWAHAALTVVGRAPRDRAAAKELARHRRVGLVADDRMLVRPRMWPHPVSRSMWTSEYVAAALSGHGRQASSKA